MTHRKALMKSIITLLISVIIVAIIIFSLNEIKKRNPTSEFWSKWAWVTITSVVTVASFIFLDGLYSAIEKSRGKPRSINMVIYIFLISLFAGVLTGGLYKSSHSDNIVQPDKYSTTRMTQLNQVLTSYFGARWPIVFGIFALFLFLILTLLYISTKGNIEINVVEGSYGKIYYPILFVGMLFSILVVFIGYNAYKNYLQEKKEEAERLGDFYDDNSSKTFEVLKYVLLLIVVGFAGLFIVSRLRKV